MASRPFDIFGSPVMGAPREFGQRMPGIEYRERPGAYAIIPDDAGRIAVMMLGEFHFLPGGGTEAGETPHQALAREIREECGRGVEILRELGQATQLINAGGRSLAKIGSYYEAAFIGDAQCPTETDHELRWLAPNEAIEHLKHEAQKWAVQAWADSRNAPP